MSYCNKHGTNNCLECHLERIAQELHEIKMIMKLNLPEQKPEPRWRQILNGKWAS